MQWSFKLFASQKGRGNASIFLKIYIYNLQKRFNTPLRSFLVYRERANEQTGRWKHVCQIGCHDNAMAVYDDGRLSLALHFSRLYLQVKCGRSPAELKSCIPAISPCSKVMILVVFSVSFLSFYCRLSNDWLHTEMGTRLPSLTAASECCFTAARGFILPVCLFFLPHLSNLPFSLYVVWPPSYLPLLAMLFLKSCILLYNIWGYCKQTGLQL